MSLLRKPAKTIPTLPAVERRGVRVFVRPPRIDDAETWAATRNRNRAFLAPFEPLWPAEDLTATHFGQRLARQAADWRLGRGQPFLIFLQDGALIGGINVNNIARGAAQYASLGYWLDEARQGQGLMLEALQLVIAYGFEELKLHRFNAGCLTHNTRSHKLLFKCGFRVEGLAEKYLEIAGEWSDHVLFGLPVERWLAASSA